MAQPPDRPSNYFTLRRALIPLFLALLALAFFFWKFFDLDSLKQIPLTGHLVFWLCMAGLMVAFRAGGYILRLMVLARGMLNFRQSFQLIFLWEFASAVTPSTVGGSAVAIYLIAKEKIRTGYSTAIVLVATFLDEVYFILLAPVFLLVLGKETLFGTGRSCPGVDEQAVIGSLRDLTVPFFIGYGLLLSITLFITISLFTRPGIFRSILRAIFKLPFLRRYSRRAARAADEIEEASGIYKKERAGFWIRAGACTALSWTARYLALNCIFVAFAGTGHMLEIFARQFVMWVIMLIPATPGGSLIAETVFTTQLCPYVELALLPVVLAVWRLFTYLPYLFMGPVVLPFWMRRVNA